MPKNTKLDLVVAKWQKKVRSQKERPITKKDCKTGYKLQNTFDRNLRGVPGGRMDSTGSRAGATVKMISAKGTGTKTVPNEKVPGLTKSARNSNTTQGSYVTTILRDQTTDVISNAQGRRV